MVQLFPRRGALRLAFDLGTANIRVISNEAGLLVDEPSICCFERGNEANLVAAGVEAMPMADRTPKFLKVQRPLQRGVLQDINAARALLGYARKRAVGRRRSGPASTLIGIPADATQSEQRALLTAAADAQMGRVQLVSEPLAAAIGAGLPIGEPVGSMLVECGAGTTEIVVISLGGICVHKSVRVGGSSLDQAIADHLHSHYKFLVGERTSEFVKLRIVEAQQSSTMDSANIQIRGRSLSSGLPATIVLPADAFIDVVRRHVATIIEAISDVLTRTPAELSHDICENGITLTGGSSELPMLKDMITQSTGLDVVVAEDPKRSVARGLVEMLEY